MGKNKDHEGRRTGSKMKICTYFPAGFPNVEASIKIMEWLCEFSDMLEIGIPFSDPIADGPTLQKASTIALERGFKVEHAFRTAQYLKERFPEKKILFMTYFNIVFRQKEKFLIEAKKSGIWGLIIPDLIPGESEDFEADVDSIGLKKIFFVAPTTPKERIKFISQKTTGFI